MSTSRSSAVGLLDAVIFVAFARRARGRTRLADRMLSQSGRAVAIVVGVLLFRERLNPRQCGGAALLAAGLTLAVI